MSFLTEEADKDQIEQDIDEAGSHDKEGRPSGIAIGSEDGGTEIIDQDKKESNEIDADIEN
ncbi:MAG: hypothetical protein Q4E53_07065 [Eubacteriales bacterium]|nr:hypothetical protein [Eubacteriales bacterium]